MVILDLKIIHICLCLLSQVYFSVFNSEASVLWFVKPSFVNLHLKDFTLRGTEATLLSQAYRSPECDGHSNVCLEHY